MALVTAIALVSASQIPGVGAPTNGPAPVVVAVKLFAVESIPAVAPGWPMDRSAVSVSTSAVITVPFTPSSKMLPVVAVKVTSPAVVPAFTVATVISPVAAVMLMSLASVSVVETTLVTVVAPPVVMVIGPFAAVMLVSVTASSSSIRIAPATVLLAVMLPTAVSRSMPAAAVAFRVVAAMLLAAPLPSVMALPAFNVTVVPVINAFRFRLPPLVVRVTLPAADVIPVTPSTVSTVRALLSV